jgi:hypothetical protein
VTVAAVGKLVDANRYAEALRELQALPRERRLQALMGCRYYLGTFAECVRADVQRIAATREDALDTLLALEGAELVDAGAATLAKVREGLQLRWSGKWQAGEAEAPPVQVESPSNLAVVQVESPSNLAVVQADAPSNLAVVQADAPPTVQQVVELVGAEVAQQALADRFQAISDGAAHAQAVIEAEALSIAEADALVAAVQAEALRVGGAAADGVDGDAARAAYRKAKAAERESKRAGVFLTVRVPQALADRLDAAAAMLPDDTAPPAGWGRSGVLRAAIVAGLDALERKAKRGER